MVALRSHPRSNRSRIGALLFLLLSSTRLLLLFLVLFISAFRGADSQLSQGFYDLSCPDAEALVRNAVRTASESDSTVPGKLLRLLFHDCMVEGCDASVLLKGNATEQTDPANRTLGGFEAIDAAKNALEDLCPGVVSCADIVVLAARDAVELTGGPFISVPTGRLDGRQSQVANVRTNIIDTSFTIDEMLTLFAKKGLTIDDLVTLSGGHTIGASHCGTFSSRFKTSSDGTVVSVDPGLDGAFAVQLAKQCPDPTASVSNDPLTSSLFDNQYYQNLLHGRGLLDSDAALVGDARTKAKVQVLAGSQDTFFQSWEQSFLKLASVGVKTGDQGEVRQACGVVNFI